MNKILSFVFVFVLVVVVLAGVHQAAASAYTDAVLAENPLFYWNFDEAAGNAQNLGSVGNAPANQLAPQNSATRGASTSTAGGVSLGLAAEFDGQTREPVAGGAVLDDCRFYAADLDGTDVGDQWALEFWAKQDDLHYNRVLDQYSTVAPSISHSPMITMRNPAGNGLTMYTHGGWDTGITPLDTAWHHYVLVNDRTPGVNSGDAYWFQDGVLVTTWVNTVSAASRFTLVDTSIGAASLVDDWGADSVFDGKIDEVAVYNLDGETDLEAAGLRLAQHYFIEESATPGSMIYGK